MPTTASQHIATCAALTRAIGKSRSVQQIYDAALDALGTGLGVERASILLFDADGVMRFKAFRGLSETYRRAVEGHTPWQPDSPDPQPIWVADVLADPSLGEYVATFAAERIRALAFIPLVSLDRVIGKFMLYYAAPTEPHDEDLQLASVIAAQVAFAVERTRSEDQARRSEQRLRFALDAASMGTWDWDLTTNAVQWSDNLATIHGLPRGSFDGTFASYEREIHPDDRGRVFESVQRALRDGVPHDVEYRLVAPDGTVRWCEGKGRVEYDGATPVRMTGVCMMVTRRKEAELARLAAAEESSRLKDEFLATLSHELRTPLNAIVGWVYVLQTAGVTPPMTKHAIEVIARNARLQSQLIEDILDVSRIITGKLEIEHVPVSVHQFLETAIAGIAPAAAAKAIGLDLQIPAALPPIEGDPKRLQQVLNNVLANAIKFTPHGGTIVLSCQSDGASVILQVRDSGIGIEPEFLPYIFDRFRQGDSRPTRAHGGLGLGLAIARHLVDQHDGEITASSDGTGKGTTISIVLPASSIGLSPGVAESAPNAVDTELAAVHVLVVDDQADSREMLAMLLEQHGATVVQRDSAESALAFLGDAPVDVMIADIAMPGIDGYELLQRLRAGGNHTPAIALTAFAHADDQRRALECGYDHYLAKPVDAASLVRTVRRVMAPLVSPGP